MKFCLRQGRAMKALGFSDHADRRRGGMILLCLASCAASVCGGPWHESASGGQPSALAAGEAVKKPADAGIGVKGMINVPVSSKIPFAGWPRAGVPDYTFSVRSHGGAELGTGLQEFDWTLQVESRRSVVSVEYFRSDADVPGQPIGVFRQSIEDEQLRDFRKIVSDVKLFEMKPAMKGHPGYTEMLYTLVEPPNNPVTQRINNSDEPTNATLDPLPGKINRMLGGSFGHPERAVLLGIARTRQPPGEVFEVTATNIGIERICFTDPRWIVPSGPLQQSVVRIADSPGERPGESVAYDWKNIALSPMDPRPPKEPLVTLDPGAIWKATTAPYQTLPGKRYLAYFTWASYAGEPLVNGVYRIRGRADSPRLVIAP